MDNMLTCLCCRQSFHSKVRKLWQWNVCRIHTFFLLEWETDLAGDSPYCSPMCAYEAARIAVEGLPENMNVSLSIFTEDY